MTPVGPTSRELLLGKHAVWPPVVLAPMAGITNAAFRRLCREYGAGVYVSAIITSRALVERDTETLRMMEFAPDESPRSVQLYGVDPAIVGEAVRMVVAEDLADHVDLNFGCPVPKVTRKGGGSALPYKRWLLRDIVHAAVRAAEGLSVTVKIATALTTTRSPISTPDGSPRTRAARGSRCTGEPPNRCTASEPTGTPSPGSSRHSAFRC